MAAIESDSNFRDRICPEYVPTPMGGTALRTASVFMLMFATLIAQAGELPENDSLWRGFRGERRFRVRGRAHHHCRKQQRKRIDPHRSSPLRQ